MGQVKATFRFYNADNNRPDDQVNKEVRALLNVDAEQAKQVAVLGLCECTGLALGKIDGYHLVRDTSSKSRENIAAYVRRDLWGDEVAHWVDLSFTWPRTQGSGTHEPRSYCFFWAGAVKVYVYHAPPKNAVNAEKGQQQGIDSLAGLMGPSDDWTQRQVNRPQVALADWNRTKGQSGPGPSVLAKDVGGKVWGAKIDAGVKRGNGSVDKVSYPTTVNGVALKSDHGHAFSMRLTADESWFEA